jgi:hypothetical protein
VHALVTKNFGSLLCVPLSVLKVSVNKTRSGSVCHSVWRLPTNCGMLWASGNSRFISLSLRGFIMDHCGEVTGQLMDRCCPHDRHCATVPPTAYLSPLPPTLQALLFTGMSVVTIA